MEAPERRDLIAQFPAWVFESYRLVRYRGFATADLWVYPRRLVVRSRELKLVPKFVPAPQSFKEIEYRWPTVVVETFKPTGKILATSEVLIEIHGRLGCVSVRGRRRLRDALEQAGFGVVEVSCWGWEHPSEVSRDVLGDEAANVPPCVVSP